MSIDLYDTMEDYFKAYHAAREVVRGGNITCVQTLTQIDSLDWNIQNKDGNTALMIAAKKNNIETLQFLIQHPEINMDFVNNEGDTALSILLKRKEVFQ